MANDPEAWAQALTRAVGALLKARLSGAYLHGSGALGGFVPGRSDIDLLLVVDRPLAGPAARALAATLTCVPACPGSGLECSVLTREQAKDPAGGRFELHVCTGVGAKVVEGRGHAGDPDLVLHSVVVRAAGVTLAGPPPVEVFGTVSDHIVLSRLGDELAWALDNAPTAYGVLNACRAGLWVEERRVASKIDGGEWGLRRYPSWEAVINQALDDQRQQSVSGGTAGSSEAQRFVRMVLDELGAAR